MKDIHELFADKKPLIAMVHLLPTLGTPLYDAQLGMEGNVKHVREDLEILLEAGFDALLFCNEGDRPYSFRAGYEGVATMTRVVTELAPTDRPFGVDFLWDPRAALAVAAATGACFVRGVMTGAYESDMGSWSTDAADLLRERRRLNADQIGMFMNVTPEFASRPGSRSIGEVARSVVVSSLADAILVSGPMASAELDMGTLKEIAEAVDGAVPVIANTGVRAATVGSYLEVADGIIVGSDLKVDGYTWNAVDPGTRPVLHEGGTSLTLLLGIDIGTTGTKALLLDPHQGPVAEAERPSQLHSVLPGWAEEDPDAWWSNVCALTRELGRGADIAAIGVTGMVPCTILLDAHDRALRWSVQQNDARSGAEVAELNRRLAGARVLERTGSAITQQATGPRFLWFAEHEPDIWQQTRTVLGSYDYIAMRLTGERAVEANWALETGLFDFRAGSWADDVVAASGGRLDLLPPIRRPEETVGHLTAEAARETGLPEGIPVVAGSADHIGSAFAAGILDDGDVLVKLGGAGDIMLAVDEPLVDERLYLDFHLLPGRYMMSGCMATSGSLIRWFQRVLAAGADLAQLDLEADRVGPGAGGVIALPYFLGEKTPINDPDATGAFVGLQLTHERGNLFRAVLEGIAYGFRHHFDVLAELGHTPRRVRVTDGGSKSKVWTQITADVIGLPLEKVAMRSGSAVAAAFVAGVGVGVFSNWRDIERFVEVTEVVESHPDPVYDSHYATYRALYPALKEVLS